MFSGRITAEEAKRQAERFAGLNPFVFRAYYCVSIPALPFSDSCLNPFVFRAYYCVAKPDDLSAEIRSQSLCFQGVLLRGRKRQQKESRSCLNPFVFRAYYCAMLPKSWSTDLSLNPFVFRAYYCVAKPDDLPAEIRSQSLCFQGVLLRGGWNENYLHPVVSIPLFSGRITASIRAPTSLPSGCLNPFVFRAYYCGGVDVEDYFRIRSQSLCFQGVLLREKKMKRVTVTVVSIPLFSGRITAPSAPCKRSGTICLNPFVFRAYYCGRNMQQRYLLKPVSIPLFSGRITAAMD